MPGRKASGGSREGQPVGIGETPRTSTESVGLTHLRHWPRGLSGGCSSQPQPLQGVLSVHDHSGNWGAQGSPVAAVQPLLLVQKAPD